MGTPDVEKGIGRVTERGHRRSLATFGAVADGALASLEGLVFFTAAIALALSLVGPGAAAANIVTVNPGEVLRLTFTAPFPENCVNPISFPGTPPAPCNAFEVAQDSSNRVTPVGVLVTGKLFDGTNLLGTQTSNGCTERGPNGDCNGFLFLFPVGSSGIVNGILDLTFSAPVVVDLSATRFILFGEVVNVQGNRLAGVFPPILSATVNDIVKILFAQLYDVSGSPVLFVSATSTAAPGAELAITVPGCLTNRPMDLEDGQYVFAGLVPECSNIALFAFFQGAEAVVTVTSDFGGSASVPMQLYPPFP